MTESQFINYINSITVRAQLGFGLAVIAFLLFLKFFTDFGDKKSPKKR
jgi:hypothetical protein